jgi:GTP-binding protein
MQFVDYVKIHVKAGDGGRGCVSFRREKYVPRGGPNGGDGGRGGNVIIMATNELSTLLDQKYKREYKAQRGAHGKGKKMDGESGEDLIIHVPVGTVIKDAVTDKTIADLDSEESYCIVAKGGRGGLGNAHFATPVRKAPRFAQPGEKGEERWLVLELKLIADVGLIGLPNAGKSMLISVISSAKPKIAEYPFTTLVPNLGVVKLSDFRSFVVADIPGLIEDAHKGAGLGLQFLRHVERTLILLHLIDVSDMAEGDPVDNFKKINKELGLYSPLLLEKQQAVAATKLDIADKKKLDRLGQYCKTNGVDFLAISAATGQGIEKLLAYLIGKVEERKRRKL